MSKTPRYIEQATIFDRIGKPKGYDELERWQKHGMRHDARLEYDRMRHSGHNHKYTAYVVLESAKHSARFYEAQNRHNEINKRCGAKAKRTGKPCRMKPIAGKDRCKYHGGLSTGPKSLQGKIRALSCLAQYKARPDLLAARIAQLQADSLGNYFETQDATPAPMTGTG